MSLSTRQNRLGQGVLLCKSFNGSSKNIGDYIQGLAAAQFLDSWTFVDRESLDEYAGEDIALIMNGWFMHHPMHFPPAEHIHPLFVSFHMNPNAAKEMLSDKTITYLKRYAPIGCRDYGTVDLLESVGVPAFYTGCLTLTLGRSFTRGKSSGASIFVDVPMLKGRAIKELLKWETWGSLLWHPWSIAKICARMRQARVLRGRGLYGRFGDLIKATWFYKTYSSAFASELLMNAEFVTHIVRNERDIDVNKVDDMHQYAQTLLRRYADAELIITSRIHCGLPTLGMGVPTCFVDYDEVDSDDPFKGGRMKGVKELFPILRMNDGKLESQFSVKSKDGRIHGGGDVPLVDKWKLIADNLEKAVMKFLEGVADATKC